MRRCIRVDPATFAAEHWSRAPLLSRAATLPRGFDDLLDLDAVDELLSRRGLRTPFLRMAKDGNVIETRRFTRSGGAGAEIGDQVADDAVARLMADGATAVLQGLHRVWPPVIEFAAALGSDLGHPVQVNAYVTPPSSRGFSAHYDVHDVFVLQLSGSKRWVIHAPVLDAPLRSQPWGDRSEAVASAARTNDPLIEAVLEPGDALYLPRGFLHAAQSLGETSAHLTVGVHPVTRYALVEALLSGAADEAELRTSLPVGVDLSSGDGIAADVEASVRALVRHLADADPDDVARRLRARVWPASRPEPLSPLRQARAVAAVDAGMRICRRPHLRWTVSAGADPERVQVESPHARLSLPRTDAAALEVIAAGGVVTVGQLPGLDADGQISLVRRLLREGVVVPLADALDDGAPDES